MAIPIEAYSVVVQRERIQPLLDSEKISIPNATSIADDDLWRCCFMSLDDAKQFVRSLELLGLNTSVGPDSDVVLVNEIDCSIDPYCEWLLTARWEKSVIAWLAGTEPHCVVAREGWDPRVGSGVTIGDMDRLKLVRIDGNVEVYRDKDSGEEFYTGRTSNAAHDLYEAATRIICEHPRTVGEAPVTGSDAQQVICAIAMLDEVLVRVSNHWGAYWFHGKGHLALGNTTAAHDSFQRAYELEKNVEVIIRELAGTCLELGNFERAVELAEEAVALHPDNYELLGNLALAHLLSGDVQAAQKTIQAAMKIDSSDRINPHLQELINDVLAGKRPRPRSMRELQCPPQPKRFWQFWKK